MDVPAQLGTAAEVATAGTRERVLHAAGDVFAERGFRESTVREICQRAGANIAAVNYHFRSKEDLYHAVLEHLYREAFARSGAEMPGVGVGTAGSAEDRLRWFVSQQMRRIVGDEPRSRLARIMAWEMVDPTPAIAVIADRFIRPQMEVLDGVVAELLGPAATPERVRLCSQSVIGQALFYKHARVMLGHVRPGQGFDARAVEELASHVAGFSLAAIGAIRARAGVPAGGNA